MKITGIFSERDIFFLSQSRFCFFFFGQSPSLTSKTRSIKIGFMILQRIRNYFFFYKTERDDHMSLWNTVIKHLGI